MIGFTRKGSGIALAAAALFAASCSFAGRAEAKIEGKGASVIEVGDTPQMSCIPGRVVARRAGARLAS